MFAEALKSLLGDIHLKCLYQGINMIIANIFSNALFKTPTTQQMQNIPQIGQFVEERSYYFSY